MCPYITCSVHFGRTSAIVILQALRLLNSPPLYYAPTAIQGCSICCGRKIYWLLNVSVWNWHHLFLTSLNDSDHRVMLKFQQARKYYYFHMFIKCCWTLVMSPSMMFLQMNSFLMQKPESSNLMAKVTSDNFCQIPFVRCRLLGTFECGLHKDMNTRWQE